MNTQNLSLNGNRSNMTSSLSESFSVQNFENTPSTDVIVFDSKDEKSTDKISIVLEKVFKQDLIPTLFIHSSNITQESIDKVFKDQTKFEYDLQIQPNNFNIRYRLAQNSLLAGLFSKFKSQKALNISEKEKYIYDADRYLGLAEKETNEAYQLSPLQSDYYYTKALIEEYKTINCKNIAQVVDYLYLLKVAFVLSPSNTKIQEKINKACFFLMHRWKKLEDEKILSQEEVKCYNQEIESYHQLSKSYKQISNKEQEETLIASRILKTLFIKTPFLFGFASNAHYKNFFENNPPLQSIQKFEETYPEVSLIIFNSFTEEEIQKTLKFYEKNPLMRKCLLIQKTPFLTLNLIKILQNALATYHQFSKTLEIFLGNPEDATNFYNSGIKKLSAKKIENFLSFDEILLDNSNDRIYKFSLKIS